MQFPRILSLWLLSVAVTGHAGGIPDTGMILCYPGGMIATHVASVARDAGTHPRQDCRYGNDPAASVGIFNKTGAGSGGSDYTKIANNGTALPDDTSQSGGGTGPTAWACTRDNITGLTWELKSAPYPINFRDLYNKYTWYNPLPLTNGGSAGSPGDNTSCVIAAGSLCNTQAYTAAVNAAQLCTYSDWRLPTRREIRTLFTVADETGFDRKYFTVFEDPISFGTYLRFWTRSTYVADPLAAWTSDDGDNLEKRPKTDTRQVLLVRGQPF